VTTGRRFDRAGLPVIASGAAAVPTRDGTPDSDRGPTGVAGVGGVAGAVGPDASAGCASALSLSSGSRLSPCCRQSESEPTWAVRVVSLSQSTTAGRTPGHCAPCAPPLLPGRSLFFGEAGDLHLAPAAHRRFVCTDARSSPIRRGGRVDPGLPLLHDAHHELMYEVGM